MYLNTHNVCNIGTNILTEKCNGEIFEGGVVAKPWYFTVLAGSPPQKNPLPMLEEPLYVSYPEIQG